ncbi:MAG: DUF423 domain-containing protein [Gammaproteobacteria bacterium]|nr:DUF423 domain-containing protein [Gammaproteobacteria bacterium]
MTKFFLVAAALNGMLAVTIGAFGAHGLKRYVESDLMTVYQTGVQYHFYHTLALLGIGLLLQTCPGSRLVEWSGWAMLAGILLFSGSLYLLTLTGARWLGAITPVGGLCFIVGWLLLAGGILRCQMN